MKYSILLTDTTGENGVHEINCNGYAIIAQTDDGYSIAVNNVSVTDISEAICNDQHFIQAACVAVGQSIAFALGKKVEVCKMVEKLFEGRDD